MNTRVQHMAQERRTPAIIDIYYLDGGVGRYANPGCPSCGNSPEGGYGSHLVKEQMYPGEDTTRLKCPACGWEGRLSVLANYDFAGRKIV